MTKGCKAYLKELPLVKSDNLSTKIISISISISISIDSNENPREKNKNP